MRKCLSLLALLGGLASPVVAAPVPELVLGEARFQGVSAQQGAVDAFLGLPFAQPPVGELRWQSPRPPEYPAGKLAADAFAPACFQGDHITNWYRGVVEGFGGNPDEVMAPAVSEDCLYLNVWRPAERGDETLPVIVYVHGGSNAGGWSYEPNYFGHELASRGAVVITVAYRLGPFGFFAHPELANSNFGLQDIVAALRWVRTWAPELGADSERVTVMGESAGASNISMLLVMPEANLLFQRLIHQSAGWAIRELPSLETGQQQGLALQQAANVEDLAGLRALPASQLDTLAKAVYADSGFDPVAGDTVVPLPLSDQLAADKLPAIDLLIGSNADEWKIYLSADETLDNWLQQNLPEPLHDRARAAVEGLDEAQALDRLITAGVYVCPSMDLAEGLAEVGANTWVYYFSRVRPGHKAEGMGAYHGAELPYVFNTHDSWLPTAAQDRALTSAMMDYWMNFARSGNPNGDDKPSWPAFKPIAGQVMQLDTQISAIAHPSASLCGILKEKDAAEGA
ncbi:carboxylesterase/lipase family protein [Halioglobus sp. HI00S01]|uniref:carboxylesterase/lipase family protein n=2 Tax=Halioglobus sp. HI00S01 TaxID=1822214 RepID=UPI000825901B|nr:carboxylesterase family protein [Halioglobus sp. HI00S01]